MMTVCCVVILSCISALMSMAWVDYFILLLKLHTHHTLIQCDISKKKKRKKEKPQFYSE